MPCAINALGRIVLCCLKMMPPMGSCDIWRSNYANYGEIECDIVGIEKGECHEGRGQNEPTEGMAKWRRTRIIRRRRGRPTTTGSGIIGGSAGGEFREKIG